MLEIYLDPCTINSRKVLAGLDLMGAQYHYNFINYFEVRTDDNKVAGDIGASDGRLQATIVNHSAILATLANRYTPTNRADKRIRNSSRTSTPSPPFPQQSTATSSSPNPMQSSRTQAT